MNSDFRVAVGFTRHPKTIALKSSIGPSAVEYVLELWEFAAVHRPKGILTGLTDVQLDGACRWPAGTTQALLAAGFLEWSAGGAVGRTLAVRSWEEHNGYASYAEERSERARKNARLRWDKAHAASIASSNAPSPSPSPSPKKKDTEPRRTPKSKPSSPAAEPRDGFADHAFRTWEAKHGEKPPWGTSDYVALANAARSIGDDGKARKAWTRYLTETDKFFAGHPPRKFLSDLGRFLTATPKPPHAKDGAYSDPRNAGQERQYAAFREAYRAAIDAGKTREEATAAGNQAFAGVKETA